ncbi:hypothetical protein M405DRAFT_830340 [Rhizopogon salebrosus TDB-379]|nr:hypothetical protein M405DRAFT_830340 [Rhizopogon salebrosus TDB-379]
MSPKLFHMLCVIHRDAIHTLIFLFHIAQVFMQSCKVIIILLPCSGFHDPITLERANYSSPS